MACSMRSINSVEKIEQVTLLKLLGCHAMQGYYFSPPVPADQFAQFLLTDRRLEDVQPAPRVQEVTPAAVS